MTTGPAKLYVVVRGDLDPGPQLAQAVHAMAQFSVVYPELTREWVVQSNYLVCLSAPDEGTLFELAAEASLGRGIKRVLVHEPDYGDELTAIAFEPGEATQRLLASLPLALRSACVI